LIVIFVNKGTYNFLYTPLRVTIKFSCPFRDALSLSLFLSEREREREREREKKKKKKKEKECVLQIFNKAAVISLPRLLA